MFIGFVIELVVELAIGILFTGGLLTIETLMAKLGETFKALGSLLIGAVKLPFKAAEKTVSSLAKGLKSLYEFLSKGTEEIVKIIDEVFSKFRNLDNEILIINKQLEDELLDALGWSEKRASKRKSFLSREYLEQKDIKALEEYIAKKFEGLGIKLVTGADKYLDSNNARAGFNHFTGELVFRKKFTFYEMFHELKHAEEFKLIGKELYIKGASGSPMEKLIRTYKREKYVFDKIIEKKHLFNKKELEHAEWVLNEALNPLLSAGIDHTKL